MVSHIVLFRPRADIPDADRQAFVTVLNNAKHAIPSIRRFHVGRRVTHGSDYERAMTEDFLYAAVIEFADLEGLRDYLRHPAHDELGRRLTALSEASLIYDYEMQDDARHFV